MIKKLLKHLTLIIITLAILTAPIALATGVGGQTITSKGAIIIDFDTGMEIFAYNADEQMNPASMTKMMTVYLVYEAIANGTISLDTRVPISAETAEFSRNQNETNVPLSTTGTYTVDQLLEAVIVVSAGGATYALAELVGGSRPEFIELMNEKVTELEIDAFFTSVSGGPRETWVTPRAMATLARNIVKDFPEVLEKTSIPSLRFAGWTYQSTNKLLGSYTGIDGLKTGTNNVAGECFTSTAVRGDIRIITVTMGSSHDKRFADTRIMLDYGFSFMEDYLANQSPTPTATVSPTETPETFPTPTPPESPPVETPTPTPDNISPTPANSPAPTPNNDNGEPENTTSRLMLVLIIAGGYTILCITFYIIYRYRKRKAK